MGKGFEVKDNAEFRDLIRTFDYSGFTRPKRKETMPKEYHIESSIPASNYGERDGTPIDTIVIHSTRGGAATPEAELQATKGWFQNPASQVSAHLLIDINGDWYYCIPWEKAAYHAKTYNKRSIGIELVQATATMPFTDAQYVRLGEAVNWLCQIYSIPKTFGLTPGILGHEAIDSQKSDPGQMFSWQRLATLIGIGTVPAPRVDVTAAEKLAEVRADIAALARKWSA